MKQFIFSILIIHSILFNHLAYAADVESNSIVEIRQQLEKLKSENVALKQENQVLRKILNSCRNVFSRMVL